MRDDEPNARTGAARDEWPLPAWYVPFLWTYVTYAWWRAGAAELESMRAGAGIPAAAFGVATGLAPAMKLAGFLTEAGFYCFWWRGRRSALPYWRFASCVAGLSLADLLARDIAERAHGAASPIAAACAGIGLLAGGASHLGAGLRAGFGSLGLLTLGRIAVTAHVQAEAVRVRFVHALAVTLSAWLATHVAIWWTVDLLRGASPAR
jgi:hypothetical protein